MPDKIKRSKEDVSLDDIRRLIHDALQAKYDSETWLNEVYGSYVVFEKDGKYYRLAYSILDGAVQFGNESSEVERVWVETRSAQAETDEEFETLLRLDQAQDAEGAAWDVTICEPGFTKNGWYLPEDVVREAAGLFEGVDVNLYELPDKNVATHVSDDLFPLKSLLVKNKAGWIDTVRYVAGEGLKGVLHFLDNAKWLGKNMLKAVSSGASAPYGLSYDCPTRAKKDVVEGKSVIRAIKYLAADSVDIVTRPAAGGKFNRAIAAQTQEDTDMNKEQLFNLIQEKRPDLLTGKEIASVTDEELISLARMAMDAPAKPEDKKPDGGNENNTLTKNDLDLFRCGMALDKTLDGSDLPEHAKKRMRSLFNNRVFTQEDLDKAIADEKDYLAKMSVNTPGDPVRGDDLHVGIGTIERAQMAMDKTFGLTKDDAVECARLRRLDNVPFFEDMRSVQDIQSGYDDVPGFRGLRDMYVFFTGDKEVTGRFNRKNLAPDMRAMMDITSSTFSYVLGNTMGRRLVRDYRAMNFMENLLISIKKPVRDFRQQEAVLVGGFSDLADVDPETADYAEIAAVTDEESTYTIGQKGNLLTITRKTIVNDDLSIVMRLLRGITRATRRTHGKYVWNMFINNDACTDGTAWFTSGHGNLGSSALSHATALVAYKAIGSFTEKDSGEPLGLLADRSVKPNLVGPIDIMETMEQIETEEFYYSTNDLTDKVPNPLRNKVVHHVNPLFTDADDWGLLLPPDVVDMIEMGYLNGREEPEMFVADTPQSEQVFVADKIRHKIRHEYAGTPIDFRSGYKAEV